MEKMACWRYPALLHSSEVTGDRNARLESTTDFFTKENFDGGQFCQERAAGSMGLMEESRGFR
jgi:hypothetical protein